MASGNNLDLNKLKSFSIGTMGRRGPTKKVEFDLTFFYLFVISALRSSATQTIFALETASKETSLVLANNLKVKATLDLMKKQDILVTKKISRILPNK